MYNEGYLATSSRRPGLLASVIAVNIVGMAALVLFAPTVTQVVRTVLTAKTIPLDPDPPPLPQDDTRIVKSRQPAEHVTRTPPVGATKPADDGFTKDPGPLDGTGSGEGIAGGFDFTTIDPPNDPVIVAPQFSGRNAQPPYPPGLQRMEVEGAVTVRVLVGTDGRPVRIEVVRTDHDGFFTSTRDWAVRNWRFKPATKDGVPFAEWRTMTVTFRMD
jgi:periplasmic protein TonB